MSAGKEIEVEVHIYYPDMVMDNVMVLGRGKMEFSDEYLAAAESQQEGYDFVGPFRDAIHRLAEALDNFDGDLQNRADSVDF